jgi:hypothetical protein
MRGSYLVLRLAENACGGCLDAEQRHMGVIQVPAAL